MQTTNKCTPIILAETQMVDLGLYQLLDHIGAKDWSSDATSDHDLLTEVAGRLCYKSFGVGLNPNVTKVREGNASYLKNVQEQRHGSVFEHATTSIAFLDVSRILTHELVRHRAGTAYSQESQRFVRLDNLSVWIPDLSPALDELYETHLNEGRERQVHGRTIDKETWIATMQDDFLEAFTEVGELVEQRVRQLIATMGLDESNVSFHVKKQLTSAFRRMAPGGVNTNILVTTNNRNWRYLIEARTAAGAEDEIRQVFWQVASMLADRHPNTFQDMVKASNGEVKFLNSKI